MMDEQVVFAARYVPGNGYVARKWEQICADHRREFPAIEQCHPGTLNVKLDKPYEPPEETRYRQTGNYISPRAKVVEINGQKVDAWLYRGGHGNDVLELISFQKLADGLALRIGDPVTLRIVQFTKEDEPGMPAPPQFR